MGNHYFLKVFIQKYNCFYPVKIYATRNYAMNVAKEKGYQHILLEKVNKYDSFKRDMIYEYKLSDNNEYMLISKEKPIEKGEMPIE